MTLRRRLLLVYGIVILLSLGTVGVALFELYRSRQVFGALQYWNDIVLRAQKLRSDFPDKAQEDPTDYAARLVEAYPNMALASDYANFDRAREALNRLNRAYSEWKDGLRQDPREPFPLWHKITSLLEKPFASSAPVASRMQDDRAQEVRERLAAYGLIVEVELDRLKTEVERQDLRIKLLSAIVIALTLFHIAVIGSLLRRWLLHPIQHLGRQVEALGRDQPPPDPLLTSPKELANLAQALDQARQSLGSMRGQLIESERLRAIGQFAAQIAHNLRNPLASIRAAAQVTSRLDARTPATSQRMQDIVTSVDRMNQWIAGLMEVARREPTPTRDADIAPLLRRVEEALRPEVAAKDLSLTLEIPPDGLVCTHDPATLEHALIAMVVNAIEAAPLGTRIILRGGYIENGNGEPHCRVAVVDQGGGLPQEAPERIFEFAYSTKQAGMGLGLALARQALQRQGGSAHACNNADGGATVFVELPVGPATSAPVPADTTSR